MKRTRLMTLVCTALISGAGALYAQDETPPSAVNQGNQDTTASTMAGEQQSTPSSAEDLAALKGKVDGLEESYLTTKADVEKLRKIKISGYIQAQARVATGYKDATDDTSYSHKANAGLYPHSVGDFAGGKFGDYMSSQFQIRRGRVKVAYESELSQAALQLDIVPFSTLNLMDAPTTVPDTIYDTLGVRHIVTKSVGKTTKAAFSGGGVSIKDAYLRFTEPWLKSIAIKAGVFDRPFGFEISYSSSSRESPERSRLFQTLFPGERDLGVSLEYFGADALPAWAQYFNFKGGFFTGNGINLETDNNRDFIGRLGLSIPITPINMAIDAGWSLYAGKVQLLNDTLMGFDADSLKFLRDTKAKKFDNTDRTYYGGDMQLYLDIPVIGGLSLRGEYIQGVQPGQVDNTVSPKSDIPSTKPWYVRNFNGFYVMWVQNIWKYNQFVLKYDSFDPNTDVAGDDITSATELAYQTLGVGLIHHWDENVKLMLYYDHVTNETSKGLTGTKDMYRDDLYDDVLTFRIQYKF